MFCPTQTNPFLFISLQFINVKYPERLFCVIFFIALSVVLLPHCAHKVAQISRNHKIVQSEESVSQAVKSILFLWQFRRLSKLCGYIKSHPAITVAYTCPNDWKCLFVLMPQSFLLLLFCYLIFTATPTHSCSFLACRTFFSWVTLWKTSKAVSLPHFSHLISCLCSIAWKWSTCYSQGGHRHRRGLPDLVYLEAPTAKGSKVSIQTGFVHYERH